MPSKKPPAKPLDKRLIESFQKILLMDEVQALINVNHEAVRQTIGIKEDLLWVIHKLELRIIALEEAAKKK